MQQINENQVCLLSPCSWICKMKVMGALSTVVLLYSENKMQPFYLLVVNFQF